MQKKRFYFKGQFWNVWPHNLVNKQLQYAYWPIAEEVKAIDNEIWLSNRIQHEKHLVEKLFSDPFLKN